MKKRQSSENAEGGDEFFKESTSQQPSLLQIMDVQAGVALKEGDGGKQGPQLLEDPKKMSRATYKMHQTMVSQPAGDQEQTTVGAENDVDKVQTNVGETMDASNVDMLALLAEDDGIGPPSPIAQAARLPETSMQDEDDENENADERRLKLTKKLIKELGEESKDKEDFFANSRLIGFPQFIMLFDAIKAKHNTLKFGERVEGQYSGAQAIPNWQQ